MSEMGDYLTWYRVFFERFAATVNPEDQLPVQIAGYTITEAELPGEVLYWTTQYLNEKSCPPTLMTPLLRIILDEVRIAAKKQPNEFGYRSEDGVYIALRLMQAVTARVNDVCLRYLDNSKLDTLPPPPPLRLRDLKTVSCAVKNSRRVMEDRHVEIGNLEALFGIETTEPTSFYAVYDGHAGSAAAVYCAAHLHQYLAESPHFTTDLKKAMREAFLRTDVEFVRKSNEERACGGSTAVVVAVRGRKLLAAWAGDSLALLAKRMKLMQLVRPHKPSRQDERDRIESSGGTVMYWGTWRVNGQLAVSRAIGDAQYKPYVTARPEIATVELDGDEDFIVVACDGLWDFVSEDDVALSVYRQLAADPDDLKAVTKRLTAQAKRQGSSDNISIIVVFLKDPRDIAAENCPPMDLGLDNALANAPPFVMETEACKRLEVEPTEAEGGECADADDNGVDNSDSDSEDLGPETAVDADDIEADGRQDPAPPTPPAHTVGASHVDGGLVDNVAESGEESEDEWNYFKGEGEQGRTEEPDEPLRSETPCQDNSAWETSSVDMNSSPLNPDAPVFVPGTGNDVLLAESPRKPLPMDDIELPDVAQFRTEAVVRPAELLDLDNCDQLNGHHNVSIEGVKEHFNGNEKGLDSLGFGFGPDKEQDTALIQDFQRIQKDTTDFCNLQVFQTHAETNPFTVEGNEELLERLKNKERDPMSMSFYQEKDDDTCERLGPSQPCVDLNAVQPLPDSDDEDLQTNGDCDDQKENMDPDHLATEPNNDIIRFDDRSNDLVNFGEGDNLIHYGGNNTQSYSNVEFENNPQEVTQTDTPESHKLLFEQIPEIPDGKSSELGFCNEDCLDPESEKDIRASTPQEEMSQDVEMQSKFEDSPSDEIQPDLSPEQKEEQIEQAELAEQIEIKENDNLQSALPGENSVSPAPAYDGAISPELSHDVQENVVVDVHQGSDNRFETDFEVEDKEVLEPELAVPAIQLEPAPAEGAAAPSPAPAHCPLPEQATELSQSPVLDKVQSPLPVEIVHSPIQTEAPAVHSPVPTDAPVPESPAIHSPIPTESHDVHSPIPTETHAVQSPIPTESHAIHSPIPTESPAVQSPVPPKSPPIQSPIPSESPAPMEIPLPVESPVPAAAPSPEPTRPETASPQPEPAQEPIHAVSASAAEQPPASAPSPAPAPDIVPEQRSDLVTDIDIGIPESRAQEICVPVTSEIPHAGSPPPAPAAPLSDTPIAADIAKTDNTAALAAAAVGAVAATAVAAAAAATAKASPAAKKTPAAKTTPKPTPKTPTATRTPLATKKPVTTTTSTSVTKSPAVARTTPAAKTTPARTPLSAAKPASATKPAAASAPKPASVKPASKPAVKSTIAAKPAPKAAPTKEAPAAAKTAVPRAARPATAPARPAAAAAATTAAAKPAPKPISRPATAAPRPKPATTTAADKKPLPNGDVKPAARPAPRAPPARPAAAAPRAPPRATAAPAAAKSASAPRPAPRAPAAPAGAARDHKEGDKAGKELANRRLARPAPPRTAAPKAPAGRTVPVKVPKKPIEKKKEEPALAPAQCNGTGAGGDARAPAEAPAKLPPSPPPAEARLPDVIA